MKREQWRRLPGPAIAATYRHTSGWTVTRKYSPEWSVAWPWVIESPDGRLFFSPLGFGWPRREPAATRAEQLAELEGVRPLIREL